MWRIKRAGIYAFILDRFRLTYLKFTLFYLIAICLLVKAEIPQSIRQTGRAVCPAIDALGHGGSRPYGGYGDITPGVLDGGRHLFMDARGPNEGSEPPEEK